MRIKTIFLAMAAIAVCACSPSKEPVPVSTSEELFKLEVSLPVVQTKVSSGNDATVAKYQIFVFREDGVLEAASYQQSSDSKVLKVTRGKKNVAVLVNCTEITQSVTLSSLKAMALDLSANAPSAVQMFGTKEISLTADTEVAVDVTRLVAKIGIKDITNALELAQYSGQTMTITRIFLENVVGNRVVDGTSTPTTWYNKAAYVATHCPTLLADAMGTEIASGATLSANRYFYCYPNATTPNTRLVVELTIGTTTWYYPITIGKVDANTFYQIEGLKITRIGTSNPDEPISLDSATFSVNVKDWILSSVSTVTI